MAHFGMETALDGREEQKIAASVITAQNGVRGVLSAGAGGQAELRPQLHRLRHRLAVRGDRLGFGGDKLADILDFRSGLSARIHRLGMKREGCKRAAEANEKGACAHVSSSVFLRCLHQSSEDDSAAAAPLRADPYDLQETDRALAGRNG